MKFIADCMLGKLAKWLKILGFDVLYFSRIEDAELAALAKKESRTLLTRDTRLSEKAKNVCHLFIESESWEEQLIQVLDSYSLWKEVRSHSRCIDCNRALKKLPKIKARNLVAPYVLERAESLAICPGCGRVYWKGTHYRGMESKIAEILKKYTPNKPAPE